MLTVKNLTKTYHGRDIIQNLSFSLSPGDRTGIVAPSGAGKTTLIHILAGLDDSFSGSIKSSAHLRCTCFQEPGLFSHKTVGENIRYPLTLKRIPFEGDVDIRYRKWLSITGLESSEHLFPCQISGGMKQKTALVRTFLLNPDLVLLDEPFAWMDISSKKAIIRHIKTDYPNTTLFIATHSMDEVFLLSKALLFFREGILTNYEYREHLPDDLPQCLF